VDNVNEFVSPELFCESQVSYFLTVRPLPKCRECVTNDIEATSALDGESEAHVQQALDNASKGRYVQFNFRNICSYG
jgi:hypothetical protein